MPFINLLKGRPRKSAWNDKLDKSFTMLKEHVCWPLTRILPDFFKPFKVEIDASEYVIDAILYQVGHPIAFKRKKFNLSQTHYLVQDKELLLS